MELLEVTAVLQLRACLRDNQESSDANDNMAFLRFSFYTVSHNMTLQPCNSVNV